MESWLYTLLILRFSVLIYQPNKEIIIHIGNSNYFHSMRIISNQFCPISFVRSILKDPSVPKWNGQY